MDRAEATLERYSRPIFLALAGLAVLRIAVAEWWRDEYQSWAIAAFSSDIPTMIHALRYEGHPVLYYLLLFPIAHAGISPTMFKLAMVAASVGGLWILWREQRVPMWFKAAVAVSVVWAETLMARSYVLLPMFIIGSSLIRGAGVDPKRRICGWLTLALAPGTHVMGAPAAAGIGLLWLLHDRGIGERSRREAVAPLIAAGLAVVAVLPAIPAADAENPFRPTGAPMNWEAGVMLAASFFGPLTRFVPMITLAILLIGATLMMLTGRQRIGWVVTLGGSLFISVYTGSGYARMGVALLSALVVFLAYEGPPQGIRRFAGIALATTLVLTGLAVIPTRTTIPNGAAGALARDIQGRVDPRTEVIVTPDYFAASVASELDRLVWAPECRCGMAVAEWSRRASTARADGGVLLATAVAHAEAVVRDNRKAVVITSAGAKLPQGARLLASRDSRGDGPLSAWLFEGTVLGNRP